MTRKHRIPGTRASSERKRFAIYAGVVLLLVTLLVIGAWSRERRAAYEALQRAREKLTASGAPTSLAELWEGREPAGGVTMRWLDDFQGLGAGFPDEPIHDTESLRARLADCRSEPGAITELVDLTALLACVEGPQGGSTLDLLDALAGGYDAIPELDALDDCQHLAVRVSVAVDFPQLERALGVGELAPIDGAGLLVPAAGEPAPFGFPDLKPIPQLHLVETLTRASILAAIDGDDTETIRRLELAFHSASLTADAPWLVGCMIWSSGQQSCLETLQVVLPCLPSESDLTVIEQHVRNLNPRGRLLDAVKWERALALDAFESLRQAGPITGEGSWRRLVRGEGLSTPDSWRNWGIDLDELAYLEAMDVVLVELERGGPEGVRALEAFYQELRSEGGLCSSFLWRADRLLEVAEELEAARRRTLEALDTRVDLASRPR